MGGLRIIQGASQEIFSSQNQPILGVVTDPDDEQYVGIPITHTRIRTSPTPD